MKLIISTLFMVIASLLVTHPVVAKDRPTPKRELPVVPGHVTVDSVESTPNEVSVPINLTRPEAAIDNAMSTPIKYNAGNTGIVYTKTKAAEVQKARLQKADAIARKKGTYKKHMKRDSIRKNSTTYSEPE